MLHHAEGDGDYDVAGRTAYRNFNSIICIVGQEKKPALLNRSGNPTTTTGHG
jgi:hypothetical protein